MRKRAAPDEVNLTPMIDVVFQMIIFFVFTIDLDNEKFDETIEPPDAKEAEQIEEFTNAVIVQVTKQGHIKLGGALYSQADFRQVMRQTVAASGQGVPIYVYASGETKHKYVKSAMDICSSEGLYVFHMMGLVEKGSNN